MRIKENGRENKKKVRNVWKAARKQFQWVFKIKCFVKIGVNNSSQKQCWYLKKIVSTKTGIEDHSVYDYPKDWNDPLFIMRHPNYA